MNQTLSGTSLGTLLKCVSLLLTICCLTCPVLAIDFTRFRGADATGVVIDDPRWFLRLVAEVENIALDGDFKNSEFIEWYQPQCSPDNTTQIVYGDHPCTVDDPRLHDVPQRVDGRRALAVCYTLAYFAVVLAASMLTEVPSDFIRLIYACLATGVTAAFAWTLGNKLKDT